MGRLGERAWWAPRPLRRLHARIGLREGPARARLSRRAAGRGRRWPCIAFHALPIRTGLLGLGSNVGDRRAQLQGAVDALPAAGVEVEASSSVYDTDPVGEVQDQPSFLNACVRVRTALEPLGLLDAVKAPGARARAGRRRSTPRAARDRHRHPAARRAGAAPRAYEPASRAAAHPPLRADPRTGARLGAATPEGSGSPTRLPRWRSARACAGRGRRWQPIFDQLGKGTRSPRGWSPPAGGSSPLPAAGERSTPPRGSPVATPPAGSLQGCCQPSAGSSA